MPRRNVSPYPPEFTCIDCVFLRNEVEDLQHALSQLTQRVTYLTLQMTIIKHDLFGQDSITQLDSDGELPVRR